MKTASRIFFWIQCKDLRTGKTNHYWHFVIPSHPHLITKITSAFGKVYAGLICVFTPGCHEMTRLISLGHEKPHSRINRLRMSLHFGVCIWCKRYNDQIGLLGWLCRRFAEESAEHGPCQLSEEAKVRIKEKLSRTSP